MNTKSRSPAIRRLVINSNPSWLIKRNVSICSEGPSSTRDTVMKLSHVPAFSKGERAQVVRIRFGQQIHSGIRNGERNVSARPSIVERILGGVIGPRGVALFQTQKRSLFGTKRVTAVCIAARTILGISSIITSNAVNAKAIIVTQLYPRHAFLALRQPRRMDRDADIARVAGALKYASYKNNDDVE